MAFKVFSFLTMLACFYFSVLEIFFWEQPSARRLFRLSIDYSIRTKRFGFMMGLGILSLGLLFVFGFVYLYKDGIAGIHILVFSMSIAILVGFASSFLFNMRFFFLQVLPAIIGLFCL